MPFARPDVGRSPGRWPPLLLALRRAARPDRARVAAYFALAHPASLGAYAEFLAVHREWILALGRALAGAGLDVRLPLPDAQGPLPERELDDPSGASLTAAPSRAHALGHLYVLEAFRLGCTVLARRLRGRTEEAHPGQRGRCWPWGDLADELGRVPPEEHRAVIEGARDAFAAWEASVAPHLLPSDPGGPREKAA